MNLKELTVRAVLAAMGTLLSAWLGGWDVGVPLPPGITRALTQLQQKGEGK